MKQHQSFNVAAVCLKNSAHLSVEHFEAWGVRQLAVQVAAVSVESVTSPTGSKSEMPVLHFDAAANGAAIPGLALNKTNMRRMKQMAGSVNSDDWLGQEITLQLEEGKLFGGGRGDTIRIKYERRK